MWRRNVCILSLAVVAGCLDVVSVPTGGTPTRPLPSAQAKGEHLWVFHIAGGPYADHIQLVSIGDHADAAGRRVFRPLSSRAWDGSIVNDFTDLQATAVDTGGLSWSLHGTESGLTFGLRYALTADTAIGAFSLADGTSYPVFGVRFDSATVNLVVPTRPVTVSDTLPTVLIRLDDASANDRDFLQRLQLRGLTAEVAVPSRFVGQLREWESCHTPAITFQLTRLLRTLSVKRWGASWKWRQMGSLPTSSSSLERGATPSTSTRRRSCTLGAVPYSVRSRRFPNVMPITFGFQRWLTVSASAYLMARSPTAIATFGFARPGR